jgi:peptide/nickel transport system substrate-binding protein
MSDGRTDGATGGAGGLERREFLKIAGAGSAVTLLGIPLGAGRASAEIPVFTAAQASDLRTLDPHMHAERVNHIVDDNIHDPLVRRDAKNNLVPWLAEKFEVVDGKDWKFTLRKGVKFQNGNPFDARSVKFTIEKRLKSAKSPRSGDYKPVTEVKILDSHTVVFVCDKPYITLPNTLYFAPMVDEQYASAHDDEYLAKNPMGTGPFRFVEWVKDDRLVLERNDAYWAGKPEIRKLVFKPVPEAATRVSGLLAGQLDLATYIPPQLWKSVEQSRRVRLSTSIGGRIVAVVFHLDKEAPKPLLDVRVRQALNYAVNKRAIVDSLLGGKAELVGQPAGPAIVGFNPSIKPYPYDPARARALLKEAGYADGFEIKFDVAKGMALNDVQLSEAIVAQLKEVGVRAEMVVNEWTDFISRLLGRKTNVPHLLSWGGFSSFDAITYVKPLFSTGEKWSFYSNPEIDRIVDQAVGEVDQDKRRGLLQRAMSILHEQCPMIFLHVQPNAYGVSRGCTWEARSDEMIPLSDVKSVG